MKKTDELKTPQRILFSEIYLLTNNRRLPLFKNKTQLAKEIISLKENFEEGGYGDRIDSVKALLSQTMLPSNRPGHRSLPDKLKNLIVIASRNRMSKKEPNFDGFERDLEDSFTLLKTLDYGHESISSSDIEKERIEISRTASSHMIFTTKPAEISENDEKAETYKDELIDALIKGDKKYRFFFHNETIALNFWEALINSLQEKISIEDLKSINQNLLKVYIVDLIFCVHPLEILNYEEPEKRVAFCIHMHINDLYSISKLSDDDLKKWFEHIYPQLKVGKKYPFEKIEITLEDYLKSQKF